MESVQAIKQRFGIIGNDPKLSCATNMTGMYIIFFLVVCLMVAGCNTEEEPLDECDPRAERTEQWEQLDCDEDCRTNGEEVANGTDPFDGDDFVGKGNELREIRIQEDVDRIPVYTFDQISGAYLEGTRFEGFTCISLEYDENNNLTNVLVPGADPDIEITFEYENNVISRVIFDHGGNVVEKIVEFDGDIIYTYGPNPPGLFYEKFTLHPTTGLLIERESYYQVSNEWRYSDSSYEYDASNLNLRQISTSIQGYNPSTGEFYQLVQGGWRIEEFEYHESVINPAYTAASAIYIPFLLDNNILYCSWYRGGNQSLMSRKFLVDYTFRNDFTNYSADYSVECKQDNMLPTIGGFSSLDGQYKLEYLYE